MGTDSKMPVKLQPGDIFCTVNPMWLGKSINAVQKFFDPDNEAKYSHAGIITDSDGGTFEALWTTKNSTLSQYKGKQIIIGRNESMIDAIFPIAYAEVLQHKGQWYPFHRLAFFLIPPLAKYVHVLNRPVCSELAAQFLCYAGILKNWAGKDPDYIADMMTRWRGWTIIYEGVWDGY